ncbi:TonB-dependent receptor plug domain-containing protein [candidate division KSB1 bacterium]|nr:TonB-dependent receptor plug domain-containing protein [candidate division KSB1 bacterium]
MINFFFYKIQSAIFCFLAMFWISTAASITFVFSQQLYNKPPENQLKYISLEKAFSILETMYDIHIVYKHSLIESNVPLVDFKISGNLLSDLQSILGSQNLTYERVGKKTYVILPVKRRLSGLLTGKVVDDKDQPLINANVFLKSTTIGSSTNENGTYLIKNTPVDTSVIVVKYLGYKTAEKEIIIAADDTVVANFKLVPDVLDFETIIITGTRNPLTKLESSVAITTLNLKEISQRSPQNTADLLKAIPGFYIESSGGEGGNNLFARGMPADGSYRYVSLQEDGLPVFEDCEVMFANIDIFFRVDETIQSVEGIRGGTSSIYASNAPGGIINFITKRGEDKLSGIAKMTVGNYGLYRTDINFGGPISENWRFNIGGFYRYGEGVRDPGFPANRGGQIRANVTRLFENGYITLRTKFLNDQNIFYMSIPLQNKENPKGITNFNPNYGTMTSIDANYLSVPTPQGTLFESVLDDGMHPDIKTIGGEFLFDFYEGFCLKNAFRKSIIDHEFNAIFSLSDPYYANTFAEKIAGFQSYQYEYAHSDDLIENPATLNDNGLVAEVGWWFIDAPMDNFANNAQLSKEIYNHFITAGYYFSSFSVKSLWYWQDLLIEVSDKPKMLDLINLDNNISYTDDGYTRYGSSYLNYQMDGSVNAFYIVDEFKLTQKFRIDAGMRWEMGKYSGYVENLYKEHRRNDEGDLIVDELGRPVEFGYDLGDSTTLADDNVLYGDGTFRPYEFNYNQIAFSIGSNLSISNSIAIYGNISNGFRTPDDQHFVFFEKGAYRVEKITQFESGIKCAGKNLALFGALFYNQFKNLPFSDEVVDPETGDIVRAFRFADSRTRGIELEAMLRLKGFGVDITATFQDPRYENYEYIGKNDNYSGNRVRRIPKIFFDFSPSLRFGNLTAFITMRHLGMRFTDDANTGKLPAYNLYNGSISYNFRNMTLTFNGYNLTNSIGLTEGNPRVDNTLDPRNYFFMARPELGRFFTAEMSYKF